MNSANSFGLTALRSMIIEGRESVVTPIMKLSTVPSCAPLDSSASAMGIVPAQDALHLALRNPVVNQCANGHANQNVGKYLPEGGRHLLPGIAQAFALRQRG